MSFGATKLLSASGGKAYEIDQSLMFNDGDSPYLTRTPSSAGNLRTWTLSFWVKRSTLGAFQILYSASNEGSGATDYGIIYFDANDALGFYYDSSTIALTNRKFRDVGAWYHIYIFLDTTASSTGDRWGIYINGVNQSSWSEYNHPSQNTDIAWNNNIPHYIGRTHGGYYFDGYIAEFHNIDGTVKPHTDFGKTDSETGQWIPKKYGGGSYGTTGFYLKFVSGALGTDSSGSSNTWTANNLANADVLLDTPTNNFSTLNSAQAFNTTTGVLTQGNLFFAAGAYSSGHYSNISSTFNVPASGKWYAECRISIEAGDGNVTVFGVTDQDINWSGVANENLTGMDGFFTSLYSNYIKVVDSGSVGTGNTSATATSYILGMALDVDNGYAYFGVDSGSAMVWYKADGSTSGGDPTSGSTGTGGFARTFTIDDTITVSTSVSSSGGDGSQNHLNFGQNGTFCGTETAGGNADGNGRGNFFRSPPSGFKALCTKNLPDPAVKNGKLHHNTITYSGNNSTNNITGMGFAPDWVWINAQGVTANHKLQDVVSGNTLVVESDENTAGEDQSANFTAFASDGFNLAGSTNEYNNSSYTYYAHGWKAGGATTTDVAESGSGTSRINQSSRSANTTAGFSLIKYVGSNDEISNGEHTKVHHGLSSPPTMIIVKNLSDTDSWHVAGDWMVHSGSVAGFNDYTMALDTTAAYSGSYYMGTTDPDSTYIYLGNASQINDDGENFICYAWHEVEGFSSFGYYYGNGSTDGPFIYTGFRPQWVMFRKMNATGTSHWMMFNDALDPFNPATNANWADYTARGESHASYAWDFLSNGFKIRSSNASANTSGGYYMYMAFAKSPFKYSNAR